MSTVPGSAQPRKKPSLLVISLFSGGVIILAFVGILVGRGLASPDASSAGTTVQMPTGVQTPIETTPSSPNPSSTPVADQPVVVESKPAKDTTPRFTSFEAQSQVRCPQDGDKPEIVFSWQTVNAIEVWYTSGHKDAKNDNYMRVPLSGNQGNLTDEHLFPCAHRQTGEYTVTLVGADGEHVSKQWTVTDLNWTGGGSDDD